MAETLDSEAVGRNVRTVLENIRRSAQRAGRPPESVRLVAATKSVPPEPIRWAIAAGVGILGENRLQEALPKIEALGSDGVSWHFIGRLQRRKVKAVVGLFRLIHSVESLELAEEINRRAAEAGIVQPVLLEVNVGGEASKGGFAPEALEEALAAMDGLPSLAVQGLMAIPPPSPDAEGSRLHHRRLRELARSLAGGRWLRVRLEEISMGMSQDYEVAIEEGATYVRVGTAIFGARPDA
ncbi:MAG: YggS family pyridoxal phosphate-dependent enzyme [Nitrospirota bacterium]